MNNWVLVQTYLRGLVEAGKASFTAGTVLTPWGIDLHFNDFEELVTVYDFASRQSDSKTWRQTLLEMEEVLKGGVQKFFVQSHSTPDGYSASYNSWDDFRRIYLFVKEKADEEEGGSMHRHTPIGLRLMKRRRF